MPRPASRSAPLFGLAPDGVCRARPVTRPAGELLPHRFTLTAAVTQASRPRRSIFCGTFPIRAAHAVPDGGRYPPSRPVESGLSSAARPQTQAAGPVSQRHAARAQAPRRSSRPPRTQFHHTGQRVLETTRGSFDVVALQMVIPARMIARRPHGQATLHDRSFIASQAPPTAKQVAAELAPISVCVTAWSSVGSPAVSRPADLPSYSRNSRRSVAGRAQTASKERSGPG